MGRVFGHISVSVDGYIADAAGGLDWWSADDEFHRYIDRMLDSIGGMVFGRVAFEELADFWPTAGPERSTTQRQRMHELPKYVIGKPGSGMAWHNSHRLAGDPAGAIQGAATEVDGDLAVFAGAGVIRTALAASALDELWLVVHPALVGSGPRLFDGSHPTPPLRTLGTTQLESGVVVVRYAVDPVADVAA